MSYFSYSRNLPQWVGQLPESWRSDWMKWSVELSTKRPNQDQQAQFPYVSNEDIESWTGTLLREEFKPSDSDSRLFRRGDVLFNKLRPYLAKVYQATFDGVSSGELLCLRPGSNLESRFLFYVLVSKGFINTIDSETFGAKMPRADWETVGHQPLPLPPLDTQRRIAAFLDEKTARIDGLIAKKRELLERLAEKRQALITQAVTKGLNPHAPMKPSGIDWLGDIPAHWEVKRLKNMALIETGYAFKSDHFIDDGVPVLRIGDILFDGRVDLTRAKHLPEDYTNAYSKWVIRSGDFVMAMTGATVGKVGKFLQSDRALLNQRVCKLSPVKISDYDILWMVLNSEYFGKYIDLEAFGGAQPNISADAIGLCPIACPSKEESSTISKAISPLITNLENTSVKINRSIQRLTEYRSALITAAVTGQIDLPALDAQGQTGVKGGIV